MQPNPVLVPAGIPTKLWLFEQGKERESVNRILYRESTLGGIKDLSHEGNQSRSTRSIGPDQHPAEKFVNDQKWSQIGAIVLHLNDPAAPAVDATLLNTLKDNLHQMLVDQEMWSA